MGTLGSRWGRRRVLGDSGSLLEGTSGTQACMAGQVLTLHFMAWSRHPEPQHSPGCRRGVPRESPSCAPAVLGATCSGLWLGEQPGSLAGLPTLCTQHTPQTRGTEEAWGDRPLGRRPGQCAGAGMGPTRPAAAALWRLLVPSGGGDNRPRAVRVSLSFSLTSCCNESVVFSQTRQQHQLREPGGPP